MTSIPPNLLPLLAQFPAELQEKIIHGWSQSRSIISFRVNHLRSSTKEVVQALKEASLPYSVWELSDDAFTLPIENTYALKGLDIYTSGKIYVQSLASMMPALCLNLQPGQKILDMASAPGSKTTQMASMLRGKCHITALEKFGVRHEKLLHTIDMQGAGECINVIKMDALDYVDTASEKYDRILLDAPCSSDGRILLSDERTYKWFSETKSIAKAQLQLKMLEAASQILSPAGRIAYSTCSLTRGENEKVINAFLRKHPEFKTIPSPITSDYVLPEYQNMTVGRWLPSQVQEGFFLVLFEQQSHPA